jgi:hypothetical protein
VAGRTVDQTLDGVIRFPTPLTPAGAPPVFGPPLGSGRRANILSGMSSSYLGHSPGLFLQPPGSEISFGWLTLIHRIWRSAPVT